MQLNAEAKTHGKPAPDVIVYMATHKKKILPLRDTIKKKNTSENKIYKKKSKIPLVQ
jgi:hypothetical protein